MFPELLILGGIGAGAAAVTKKAREAYQRYQCERHAAAIAQMQAMQASTRLAAVAWQARQAMHQAVVDEAHQRTS